MEYVRVISVQVLGHYRLRLGFSDGSSRDVDLTGALHGPVFEPLTDPDFFAQVRVDDEFVPSSGPTARTSIHWSFTGTSSRRPGSPPQTPPAGTAASPAERTVSRDRRQALQCVLMHGRGAAGRPATTQHGELPSHRPSGH
jgi:uncharacterized protein DUF2442